MRDKPWHLWLFLIVYVVLAGCYSIVLPPFENQDEIEHFGVVRFIADHGRLPIVREAEAAGYHVRQESAQPPLYHILSAGLVRLFRLDGSDINDFTRPNPWVQCGRGEAWYNKVILYHDPVREAWPWRGAALMLHVLRGFSILLQAITVVGTWAVARLTFPLRPGVARLAAAITAFNPQFLLTAAGVNNDNLATPLMTLVIVAILYCRERGFSVWRSALIGLLAGLSILSKVSGLLLAAPIGLALFEQGWRTRRWKEMFGRGLITASMVAVVSGWWFFRNWQLYGDPTALGVMLEIVKGRKNLVRLVYELSILYRSYWGQLPCAFYPGAWFYAFFGLLTCAGVIGLVMGVRGDRVSRKPALFLATWFLVVATGWLRWDMTTPAPAGRLLFYAIAATSALLAWGFERLWNRLTWIVPAFMAVAALVTLACVLSPLVNPPPRYASPEAVSIPNRLDVTLSDAVHLAGYAARVDGNALDVTLYWHPLAQVTRDYVMAIQLVSRVPGDHTLRLNYNAWPGHGAYATSAWKPGEVIQDRYRLTLPSSNLPTQTWQLQVMLYEADSGVRLPVRLSGDEIGDTVPLTTLRVAGATPQCAGDKLVTPVRFGNAIELTHASVQPTGEGTEVVLCWRSIRTTAQDQTVFVHAGEFTADGPPMDGAFPTSLWQPGDVVSDRHVLPGVKLDELKDERVLVGLYDLETGARLDAFVGGTRLINDQALAWPR
jgi:4-amino-4-deoxy-L-arabinose transferase-like glycosyltransferase